MQNETETETVAAGVRASPLAAAPDTVNTPRFLRGGALTAWNWTLRVQRILLVVCGAALTLLIAVQVFTRYVLGISIFGIEELASFVAVYLYFLGASHGAWERGHISASLVDLVLPVGRARLALSVLAGLITVVLAGWMSLWAWQYLDYTIGRGTMSLETGLPMAWVYAIKPVGLSLMTLYFVVELLERLRRLVLGPATDEEATA
ncbi:TRAP transporter small permease [Stappia indica]|uniref:TRAP transporter small permease n=1 Tax=Stappia indica TaxID=538381 RepID=UPI001CD5C16E|nr:TRAP transporter small permease [Stappia indica]MCA1298062.1 TRAP transporter small permease [Stappia indica]